jgi:TetR/AcrR family transcriptional repressor of nem operon
MPKNGGQTKERIIHSAMYLFWERGYNATGMADLLKLSKANSGSFYYFFDSKDALLDEVLDLYLNSLEDIIVKPVFEKRNDPIDRIFGILAGYREKIIQTNFAYGCPIGRLALEIDPKNQRAREKIAANFSAWIDVIRKCLIEAKEHFSVEINAEEIAQFTLTVMEGAVMQSRMFASVEPFDASVRQLRNYFDLLM